MARRGIGQVIERLRRDLTGDLTDGQLLERFIAHRDEAAFATLVKRHGALVWGVCRRIVRDHHATEDCFQAVFLVLARKASSIASRALLANWLYGVAHNVARKAGAANMKRRAREQQVTQMPEPSAIPESLESDVPALLDLELSRLPEKYRVPILLCELQGKTHQEAARQLGCPVGTLSGRLARARTMLAKRLARRGLDVTAGTLAVLATHETAAASLISSTARAASGDMVGVVSARVVSLVEGVLKTMLLHKLKNIAMVALVVAAAIGSWAFVSGRMPTAAQSPPQAVEVAVEQVVAEPKPPAAQPKVVVGDNYLVLPVTTELQRYLHGGAKVSILIDGASIVRADGTVDSNALNVTALRKALKAYDRNDKVLFTAHFAQPGFPGDHTNADNILRWALEGLARQEDFKNVTAYSSYSFGYDWKGMVVSAGKSVAEAAADEPASGNNLVKVYPVRTAFSRQLTRSECVVHILVPSDKWERDGLPPEVQNAIRLYVGKLKLAKKESVYFIANTSPGVAIDTRVINKTLWEFGKTMGFEKSTYSGP